ncbi:hypothetical protein SO802_001850 [Lithocarpus litseifolius]|uniref:Uncharacterized protein n=1 Tax=Lithocarpus litseifolius TaxID=425828 RepID=A0AAW2E1A6_9ROSI
MRLSEKEREFGRRREEATIGGGGCDENYTCRFGLVSMRDLHSPMEIYVDDETKLTLHGLVQHYILLKEAEKNHKLNDLDALDFNQYLNVSKTSCPP